MTGAGQATFAPMTPETRLIVPLAELWWDEITFLSSYAAGPDELREATELIRGGKIDTNAMVTHRLPLARTGEGFRLVSEGESLKVIIEPQK